MRINAIPIKAKDLRPGDLFSTGGPNYWDNYRKAGVIGERVYIRTEEPTPPDQAEHQVYRIEIER